jgi:hypothetical protein
MKATIEFDLHDPDDIKSHLRCVKATDMALVLWTIYFMRKELEWKEEEGGVITSEYVMDKIINAFNDHNIYIEELM